MWAWSLDLFPRGPGVSTPAHCELYPWGCHPFRLPPSLQSQELPGPWKYLSLDLQSQMFLLQQPPERPGKLREGRGWTALSCCGVMGEEGGQLVLASLTEDRGSPFMRPFSKHLVHTESQGCTQFSRKKTPLL